MSIYLMYHNLMFDVKNSPYPNQQTGSCERDPVTGKPVKLAPKREFYSLLLVLGKYRITRQVTDLISLCPDVFTRAWLTRRGNASLREADPPIKSLKRGWVLPNFGIDILAA